MKLIYRISDGGYNKVKPEWITKRACLMNCYNVFNKADVDFHIIADRVSDLNYDWIIKNTPRATHERTNYGFGSATFRRAHDIAANCFKTEIIYFVEDDYVHRDGAYEAILEGLKIAQYITLYDHPDKYKPKIHPIEQYRTLYHESEPVTIYHTKSSHWKETISTPMTFASTAEVLIQDGEIIKHFAQGEMTDSHSMFLRLKSIGRKLINPLPAFATHGETEFLSPLINWHKIISK